MCVTLRLLQFLEKAFCFGAADESLLLEEKLGGFSRSDEARNPPLWQIQADAAPMRQRVLQASALQNDYAEL